MPDDKLKPLKFSETSLKQPSSLKEALDYFSGWDSSKIKEGHKFLQDQAKIFTSSGQLLLFVSNVIEIRPYILDGERREQILGIMTEAFKNTSDAEVRKLFEDLYQLRHSGILKNIKDYDFDRFVRKPLAYSLPGEERMPIRSEILVRYGYEHGGPQGYGRGN